jgi:hypothetical protein
MHLFASMTGCSVGGSVMLVAIASSIALMLAFSLAIRERQYQADSATLGITYSSNDILFSVADLPCANNAHSPGGPAWRDSLSASICVYLTQITLDENISVRVVELGGKKTVPGR